MTNPWMRLFSALGLVCLLFHFVPSARAQTQAATGTIEGRITGSDGAPLSNVTVTITQDETGYSRRAVTDDRGRYSVPLLPVGRYTVTAEREGFSSLRVPAIVLQLGQVRSADFTMTVAAVFETVTVDGARLSAIDKWRFHHSITFDDRTTHSLPLLGRNFQTFILLTPGTLSSTPLLTDTDFSLGGQKGVHTSFTVDGSAYNSTFFGGQTGGDRPPFTFSLEAVQEFVVQINGIAPEFGRSGGGQLQAVTKSGTNTFEGSVFWYLQDKSFVARDALGVEPLGRRQQFGVSLGGPIAADRLFFFVVSDNQKRSAPINLAFDGQSSLREAAAGSDPQRRDAAQALIGMQKVVTAGDDTRSLFTRIDWNVSPAERLFLRYNGARNRQLNGTFGAVRQRAASQDDFGLDRDIVDSFAAQSTSILSSRWVGEVRGGYTHESRPRVENGVPGTTQVNGTKNGASVSIAGIGSLGAPVFLPIIAVEDRYQFISNLSFLTGAHEIKGGTELNVADFDNGFRGGARGLYIFSSFDTFAARQPDAYFQFFGSGRVKTRTRFAAAYIQDALRVGSNIIAMSGLRWEGQYNPQPDLPNSDFPQTRRIPSDLKQWSPRLGITWSPNGGKSVVRAMAAYLQPPTATALWFNVLRANGDASNGLGYFAARSFNQAGVPPFNYPYAGPYLTPFASYPGGIPQSSGTVPGSAVHMVDPRFYNPRVFRTSVGYERELGGLWTASATYDYSYTIGNERFHDLNLFPGHTDPITGRLVYDRTVRPFPQAGQVISRESTAKARHDAMIFTVTRRPAHGISVTASYQYSHTRSDDDNERNTDADSSPVYDQFHFGLDWGRSNLDVRHHFVLFGVVELPYGFIVSPILRVQSGRPFNAITGSDDPSAYQLSPAALANLRRYIGDPNAIVYAGGNNDGNASSDRPIVNGRLLRRNAFEQPAFVRTDVRVTKHVFARSGRGLDVVADIFNVFNNENRFTTNNVITSPDFGVLNNAGEPRSGQLGLKYAW